MPGAGTDKTRGWSELPGPIIVLVEPQLGENIGAAARVMANFGLGRLRLVAARDGWPNVQARRSASGADRVLDAVTQFSAVEPAIADCTQALRVDPECVWAYRVRGKAYEAKGDHARARSDFSTAEGLEKGRAK